MKAKTLLGMLMLFAVLALLVTNARLHSQDGAGLKPVAPPADLAATQYYAQPAATPPSPYAEPAVQPRYSADVDTPVGAEPSFFDQPAGAPTPYNDSGPYQTQNYPVDPSGYGSPADYGVTAAPDGQPGYPVYVDTAGEPDNSAYGSSVSSPLVGQYVELSLQLANRMSEDDLRVGIAEMTVELDNSNADHKIKSVRESLEEIIEAHPDSPAAETARRALEGFQVTPDVFDSAPEFDSGDEQGAEDFAEPVPNRS